MTSTDKTYRCPKCREPVELDAAECVHCGLIFSKYVPPSSRTSPSGSIRTVEKPRSGFDRVVDVYRPPGTKSRGTRYPALRIISVFYRISALVSIFLAVVYLVTTLTVGLFVEDLLGLTLPAAVAFAISGIVASVTLLAVAEVIQLLIDIEANTRRSSRAEDM